MATMVKAVSIGALFCTLEVLCAQQPAAGEAAAAENLFFGKAACGTCGAAFAAARDATVRDRLPLLWPVIARLG
jgi:hypothetical protein